jgi:hypothetical protein
MFYLINTHSSGGMAVKYFINNLQKRKIGKLRLPLKSSACTLHNTTQHSSKGRYFTGRYRSLKTGRDFRFSAYTMAPYLYLAVVVASP